MTNLPVNENLTSNEERVLEYIEKNKKEFTRLTLKELAEKNFVSPPTILRLCKKLGFTGLNDLKYNIKQKLLDEKNSQEDNSYLELNGVISSFLSNTKETYENISLKNIEKVAELLCSKKVIHLFSRGLSEMPFSYLYDMLLSVNRYCIQYQSPPLIKIKSEQMTKDDVLFIGTSQGITDPIINVAKTAKKNGAFVIGITSNPNSPLNKIADITFLIKSQKRYLNNIDLISRMNIFYIVDLIIDSYFNRLNLISKK